MEQSLTRRSVRIFISTGEVSGDLQGALLVSALKRQAAQRQIDLTVVALGGDRMAAAGAQLLGNTAALGSVGIFEAVPYVVPSWKVQRVAKQALQADPPDLAILIDYMGPNLVMGEFLHTHLAQVPIVYYIAPQQWVWAYTPKDTERIVRYSNRLLSIFQEEADFYRKAGGDTIWVGHPLLDKFPAPPDQAAARQRLQLSPKGPLVALLPASRQQEIKFLLPIMFAAAQKIQATLPDVQFLVPASSERLRPQLERAVAQFGLNAMVIDGQQSDAIAAADLAITKSGTANLEIALMNVPQVVAYRLSRITAWVTQHLLKFSVPYISPVNLMLMEPIVPELLQWQATPEAIAVASLQLLQDQQARQTMLAGYARMRQAMGNPGVCDRAAQEIFNLLDVPPAAERHTRLGDAVGPSP